MAQDYSDDLRKKLLEAHASGRGTLRELAKQFWVSVGWAWKVSAAKRQTGSSARTPQRPKLRRGHVVVMDTLSAHKVDGVRQCIERAGASLLSLPPYSPDLNPIEKAWSKLKLALRAAGARSTEALHQAVPDLLHTLTPDDPMTCFRLHFLAL